MPEAAKDDPDTLTVEIEDPDEDKAGAAEAGQGGEADDGDTSTDEERRVAAMMGWKPADQWKGDKAGWRSASDFLKETPDILRNTRKISEALRGKMDRIIGQMAKLQQSEGRRTDRALDDALAAAVEGGDLDEARKVLAAAKTARSEPEESPALAAFNERNAEWLNVDKEATDFALATDRRLTAEAGGPANIADPAAHLRMVEAAVKRRFPEHFGGRTAQNDDTKDAEAEAAKEARKGPLLARSNRGAQRPSDGKITVATMTPRQRRAAEDMKVSPEDYAKSWNQFNAKEAG